MRIVCGTDFSDRSREATEIAALIAARTGARLTLVHALDARGAVLGAAHVLHTLENAAREQLEAQAERLRALGADVETSTPEGWPDEALLAEAKRVEATLAAIAATGSRDGAGISVGKTCERTLARTTLPLLVIRNAQPLRDWLEGRKALNVLVAFDLTQQSAAALAFAARFARIGACRIIAAYVEDVRKDAAKLRGREGPEAIQERLREALIERVASLEPDLPAEILVSSHQGDAAARLVHLVERESIDLVITGTHQRGPLQRLFSGSVSLQLLREAPTSVLVVPPTAEAASAVADLVSGPRELRRLAVATDLSPYGNRAVAQAIMMAPPGCAITVIHVMNPYQLEGGLYGSPAHKNFDAEHGAERKRRENELANLAPAAETLGQRMLCFEIIESESAPEAVADFAERIDADMLCVGTIGRSGLSAALLGSVARQIVKLWKRPLVLVPPPDHQA